MGDKPVVGFIGLGNIGGPMAKQVRSKGCPMVVFDLRESAVAALTAAGAEAGRSAADVASRSDVVLLSLPDSPDVERVALGEDGIIAGARPGTVVADLSSADPSSTRKIAQQLEVKGIHYADAPVSGGTLGATEGTLTVMVGGDPKHMAVLEPILASFSKQVVHVGPIGAGHTLKALNNFLAAASTVATAEALVVAVRQGIDPEQALRVINGSSGQTFASQVRFPKFVLKGDFSHAGGMAMRLMYKDLVHATTLGREAGVPMFVANVLQQIYAMAIVEGDPNAANQGIVRFVEKWGQAEVRAPGPTGQEPTGP